MTSSLVPKLPCRICLDQSNGRYFGYHLCTSCKAFFRRNADKKEKFICVFENNCEINKVTRRHCRKCRLDKCFSIGMKRDWVRIDEEKAIQSIPSTSSGLNSAKPEGDVNNNGLTDEDDEDDTDDDGDGDGDDENGVNLLTVFDRLFDDQTVHSLLEDVDEQTASTAGDNQSHFSMEVDSILQLCSQQYDKNNDNFHWSSCDDSCNFHKDHQEYLTSNSYITNCENHVCSGISIQPIHCNEKPWAWKMYHLIIASTFMPLSFRTDLNSPRVTLNHLEQEKLDELCTFASSICNISACQFPQTLIPGFFKVIECCLTRLIPSLNTVSTFASLTMEDRMCLVKRNFADILLFRATVLIDIQTETLQIPKTPIILELNGLRTVANSVFEAYMEFVKSLRPNWRTDTKANMLVLAIMLFNPETPCLSNPDIIRFHQLNYVYLLKRYLEFRCCFFCHARCNFYDLMMKIGEFQETINSREFIYELASQYRDSVGPLLSEIIDLP